MAINQGLDFGGAAPSPGLLAGLAAAGMADKSQKELNELSIKLEQLAQARQELELKQATISREKERARLESRQQKFEEDKFKLDNALKQLAEARQEKESEYKNAANNAHAILYQAQADESAKRSAYIPIEQERDEKNLQSQLAYRESLRRKAEQDAALEPVKLEMQAQDLQSKIGYRDTLKNQSEQAQAYKPIESARADERLAVDKTVARARVSKLGQPDQDKSIDTDLKIQARLDSLYKTIQRDADSRYNQLVTMRSRGELSQARKKGVNAIFSNDVKKSIYGLLPDDLMKKFVKNPNSEEVQQEVKALFLKDAEDKYADQILKYEKMSNGVQKQSKYAVPSELAAEIFKMLPDQKG